MKKYTLVAAAALAIYFLSSPAASSPRDMGEYLLSEKAGQILKLTPPSSEQTGGTGFALRTPNGNVITATNAHICEAAEGGILMARPQGYNRRVPIRVLEVDPVNDLCVLEPVKFMTGLSLAPRAGKLRQSVYILGHPLLKDVTFSAGHSIQREPIDLVKGGPEAPCTGKNEKRKEVPWGPFIITLCMVSVDAVEITAPIFPGNSGSPALNADGDVIGVVFAADQRTNHGFYIPFERLVELVSAY